MGKSLGELISQDTELLKGIEFNQRNIKKMSQSHEFLSYIESYGFNPNNYEQILELNQDVNGSISLFLKEYNQFLLSMKINTSLLHEYGISGAVGYVKTDGISIARTKEMEEYFKGEYISNLPYKRYKIFCTLLRNFFTENNVVISRGISKNDNYRTILDSNVDLFLGDVFELDKEKDSFKREELLKKLNLFSKDRDDLEIHSDTDLNHNKEFVLLSRKVKR